MKERPIILHRHEIPGILDGTRTQIRRPVKPQPNMAGAKMFELRSFEKGFYDAKDVYHLNPYGRTGDRLWVKENFQLWNLVSTESDEWDLINSEFLADRELSLFGSQPYTDSISYQASTKSDSPWRPSIHMPRWASRILLEIVDVRVERIQDISEEDCKKEGLDWERYHPGKDWPIQNVMRLAWNTTYPGSWDRNDWVWVISFKRIKP